MDNEAYLILEKELIQHLNKLNKTSNSKRFKVNPSKDTLTYLEHQLKKEIHIINQENEKNNPTQQSDTQKISETSEDLKLKKEFTEWFKKVMQTLKEPVTLEIPGFKITLPEYSKKPINIGANLL